MTTKRALLLELMLHSYTTAHYFMILAHKSVQKENH